MTTIPKKIFRCDYCFKIYRIKREFELHQGMCELLGMTKSQRQSESEKKQDCLTMPEMSNIIKVLVKEQASLKKKVETLQKALTGMKQKVDVAEYLQKNCKPGICLKEWVDNCLVFNEDDFNDLYEKKLDDVLETLLLRNIISIERVPIRSFSSNSSSAYCYEEDKWRKMNDEDWNYISGVLQSSLLKWLNEMTETNVNRLNDDNFSLRYSVCVQKTMECMQKLKLRLRVCLNKHVKMKLNNVTKFEYTFG